MSKRAVFTKLAPAVECKELAWFGVSHLALLGLALEDCAGLLHMHFPAHVTKFTVAIVIKLAD